MSDFEREKLFLQFCDQYFISDENPQRRKIQAAFCCGYDLQKSKIAELEQQLKAYEHFGKENDSLVGRLQGVYNSGGIERDFTKDGYFVPAINKEAAHRIVELEQQVRQIELKNHNQKVIIASFRKIYQQDQHKIRRLEEKVRQLEEANRWIPVSERLPAHDEIILIIDDGITYIGYLGKDGRFQTRIEWLDKVTHWKPINPSEVRE